VATSAVFAQSSYGYLATETQKDVLSLPPDLNLRILPLGDSITYGIGSTSRAGYRQDLYNLLTAAGAKVDYIGSLKAGNFEKPQNEGWSGYTIAQINQMADRSIGSKPNVILLLAGGNDILWAGNKPTAPDRLATLIDKLVSKAPDAVILVATMTPLARVGNDIDVYNQAIPPLVKARADKGQKVALVSMAAVLKTDLKEGVHPNDAGYTKMAEAWFKGIEAVANKGWIKPPA